MSDVYYTCVESDNLSYTDPGDAIEDYLSYLDAEDWPVEVRVMVYTRDVVSPEKRQRLAEATLEQLVDSLDEEHGGPDGATTFTEGMQAAAALFVDSVVEDYFVWSCSHSTKDDWTERTAAWVRKHCAIWLDDPKIANRVKELEELTVVDGKVVSFERLVALQGSTTPDPLKEVSFDSLVVQYEAQARQACVELELPDSSWRGLAEVWARTDLGLLEQVSASRSITIQEAVHFLSQPEDGTSVYRGANDPT